MKKRNLLGLLLALTFILISPAPLIAQEQAGGSAADSSDTRENSLSAVDSDEPETTNEFKLWLKKTAFIKKEFYDLGNWHKMNFEVVIATDMDSGVKFGGLCLSHLVGVWDERKYPAYLTPKELDEAIDTWAKIAAIVNTEQSVAYTEIYFRDSDHIDMGIFAKRKKTWRCYVITQTWRSDAVTKGENCNFFPAKGIPQFIAKLKVAQSLLKEQLEK